GAVAEEELLPGLGAEGRQLDADARLALHARDVVAAGAAVLAHELLAGGDVGRVGEPGRQVGRRGLLLAERHQVGGDGARLVVGEAEVRHARDRGVAARVLDPVVDPGRVGLLRDGGEVGRNVLVGAELPRDLVGGERVAGAAAERAVQVLHAGVALDAVGGLLLAAEERLLDELDVLDVSVLVEEVPVRGLDAVDRRPLPAVAGCAAELLGRMLAEEELTAGVRLPRVRLVLEAGLADASVAGHAPIDARDRLVEVVAVELLEHELLDLRNLRLPVEAEERRSGLRPGEVAERYALELLPEVVARRR